MIRVAVIGAAGYTGGEMLRLLLSHPMVGAQGIVAVSASHAGKPVWSAHPDLEGLVDLSFVPDLAEQVDAVVLCLGHGQSARWRAEHPLAPSTKLVDLGNDFRIEGPDHPFVYGLPEVNRERIRAATHVANPGCFATAIQLALLPLAEAGLITEPVSVNAITGSTGAGQAPQETTHFSWRAGNVNTYKVFEHQHEPEILQTLGDVVLRFVPLRGPFTRGIHATVVMGSPRGVDVAALYRERYADHPFVHVDHDVPDLKRVVGTNMCRLGILERNGSLMIVSVIDNLLKGASGQALQNLNLLFGLEETAGLHRSSNVF